MRSVKTKKHSRRGPKPVRKLRMIDSNNFYTITTCGPVPATERFRRGPLLGKGSFGEVYKITQQDGRDYALKILKNSGNGVSELNELNILCSIRHPNLVHIKYFYIGSNDTMGYVLPLAEGDLQQYLTRNPNTPWSVRVKWAYQFLSAMNFLQKHDIFHCDIKPENCLIVDGNLVVSDYGFSHRNFGRQGPCSSFTPWYASPDKNYSRSSQNQKKYIDSRLGSRATAYSVRGDRFTDDVWAMACTMWFIITNDRPPTSGEPVRDILDVFENINKFDFQRYFEGAENGRDMAQMFSTMFAVPAAKRRNVLGKLLQLPMFAKFAPIHGHIIEGSVVKKIDCKKIDTKPYVSLIIEYFLRFSKGIKEKAENMGIDNPTSEESFFVVFNAIDLFYRTFAALYKTPMKPVPELVAMAYVMMSSNLVVLGIETRDWLRHIFKLSNVDLDYIYQIEREVVCLTGGIMSSKLPHEYFDNISEDDAFALLILLRDSCDAGYARRK